MARISTYAVDSEIVTTDKVLGTDSQGLTTKNFSFSAVKDWLNSSAVVGVVGQNTYTFQTIPGNPVVRKSGSISLPSLGGDGTAFADITSMVFSERAADNSVATNYISTLIGKQVVLMQLDNLDNFGIYNLDSFTPLQGSPGFYTAALSVDYSNGNLISDRNYGFAVYGLQSAAPPVPSLNQVTGAGSTTNNAIEVGGLTAASLVYPSTDGTANQIIQTDGAGNLSFVDLPNDATWGNITGTLSSQTDLQNALDAKEDVSNKSTNPSMGNSDTLYPTQNAVRAFVNNAGIPKENVSNKSTDVTMGGVSPSSTLYTSQYSVATYVQNEIAAAQAGIPTFEIDMFANYKLYEYDEDGATSYLGQIKATNGNWLITKFVDSSGDIAATYANESNNVAYTTMATAWAARTSLAYEDINNLTSI